MQYCTTDLCLCFLYTVSTIRLLSKSEIKKFLDIFCVCTAQFVSDLLGKHIVSFLMMRLKYVFTVKLHTPRLR